MAKKIHWCVPVEFEVYAKDENEAVEIAREAIQTGINYMDEHSTNRTKTARLCNLLATAYYCEPNDPRV